MIASVIIGVKITKEMKVNDNNMIVSNNGGNSSPLRTSINYYPIKMTFNTPLSVIRQIKEIKFTINKNEQDKGVFSFRVVSFHYVKGRSITLYGHTHMAKLMSDGNKIFSTFFLLLKLKIK